MKKGEKVKENIKNNPDKINNSSELNDSSDSKKSNKKGGGIVSKSLNRLLFKIILILILVCLLGAGGFWGFKKLSQIKTEKRYMNAFAQLEQCAELVTVKNTYSDVVSIKKTRIAGLAKSFSIVRYNGILRCGIKDISLADVRIFNGGKSIEVVLPECEVLGNDISSLEVFDESRSIFVAVSLQEIVEEINLSRISTQEKLIEAGILEEAKAQSIMVVKNILKASGFKEVSVH